MHIKNMHYPTSAEECQTGLQSACSTPACWDQKVGQSSVRSARRFFRQLPAATWSSGSMRCCSKSTPMIWQGSVLIHVMRHLFVDVRFFLRFENGKSTNRHILTVPSLDRSGGDLGWLADWPRWNRSCSTMGVGWVLTLIAPLNVHTWCFEPAWTIW